MTTSVVANRMPSDFKLLALKSRMLCWILFLLMLSACTTTSTTIIDEEVVTNPKPMYTYKSLIIRDFELKREMYTDSSVADMSGRESRYSKIPAELSEHIERYVKARRTYREVSRDGQANASTLIVTGRFTRVGRFKISVVVSLHDGDSDQEVAYFRQTLWDVIDTTETINNLGREVADFIDRIQYK